MNRLFEKWFCKHKWKSHCVKEIESETYIQDPDGSRYTPTGVKRNFIKEVLICESCGKIKTIEY